MAMSGTHACFGIAVFLDLLIVWFQVLMVLPGGMV